MRTRNYRLPNGRTVRGITRRSGLIVPEIMGGTTLFSDGFESGDFSAWTSSAVSGTGSTATVTTGAHHTGTYGADLNKPTIHNNGFARATKTITAPASKVESMQTDIYIVSNTVNDGNSAFFALCQLNSAPFNRVAVFQQAYSSPHQSLTVLNKDGTITDTIVSADLSLATWHTVVLTWDWSGTDPVFKLYFDGVRVALYTDTTTGTQHVPDSARIGIVEENWTWIGEAYYDNVIVADTDLGNPTQTLSPTGIASAQAFGTATITSVAHILPTGIASTEAFGTPKLAIGVKPTGIASGEAFGTPRLAIGVKPAGIATGEAFGTPTITSGTHIFPTGIPSATAFGTPALTTVAHIQPTGIPSGQAFGTPIVGSGAIIRPSGIASGEAFGVPTVHQPGPTIVLSPSSIASAEAFGVPSVQHISGAMTILPDGTQVWIPSNPAPGTEEPTTTSTMEILPDGTMVWVQKSPASGTQVPTTTGAFLLLPDGSTVWIEKP